MNIFKTACLLFVIYVLAVQGFSAGFFPFIEEPLTDGKTAAIQKGGQFNGEGWRTTSSTDKLRYILPDSSFAGLMEFEVKGWHRSGSLDQHVWSVCNVLADSYKLKAPCYKHDCIQFRVNDNENIGKDMFRAHGYIMSGAASSNITSCDKYVGTRPKHYVDMGFTEQNWSRVAILWNEQRAAMQVDGTVKGSIGWSSKHIPRKVINLGHDPYYGYRGRAGATFRNVKISLDLPVVLNQPGNSVKGFPKVFIHPNPASSIAKVGFYSRGSIKNTGKFLVDLYSLNGKKLRSLVNKGNSNRVFLNTSDLNPGIYVIKLKLGQNAVFSKKIAIIR
jgi:hypothetical protein